MKYLFDTHTHSTISDGGRSPREMLESAEAKGFDFLALTDHFDIHDQFPKELSRFDGAGRESSYRLLTDLKEEYDRKYADGETPFRFLKGIEIGQAHHHKEVAEKWLNDHDYDYVIASCHIIRGQRDFYHADYVKNDPNVLLKQYFDELAELCSWGGENRKFDTLAHLSYPLRYMKGAGSLDGHGDSIDRLFTVIIKYEIALEINTQTAILCPELPQIRRYYELGGRLVTIGSDSHNTDTIGGGIDRGVAAAKKAGFTECAYYENRELKFIKI